MSCEPFVEGDSFLHRADPRAKLVSALALSLSAAALATWPGGVAALMTSAALALWARLPLRPLLRRLGQINLFILFLWAVLPFTPPRGLHLAGPIFINGPAAARTLLITLKCNAICLALMALVSTSTVFSVAHALAHLRVPAKLVHLFFFTWRYIHLLEREWQRMFRAARLRGFRPSTDLHTYRTISYLVGSLMVKSYDRGQRVLWAMRLRGFRSTFWLLDHFRFRPADGALTAGLLTVAAALVALDRLSHGLLPWWPL